MPYCTKQDMIDRFGQSELVDLTDRADLGVIDDTVLTRAIDDASAEIDSYLSGRYELPLDNVPSVLVRFACNMARYHLYDEGASEQVNKNYDGAVKFLRAVSKGDASIGPASDGSEPQTDNTASMESGGRIFGRDGNGNGGFI